MVNLAIIDYHVASTDIQPATGDNYVTINCENNGYFAGTFNIQIHFENAEFSTETSQPHEQLDNQTAKFTYNLQGGEKQATEVHFTINSNATDFYITYSFHPSGFGLIRDERSDAIRPLDEVSFQKDPATGNYSKRMPIYPP